MFRLLKLNQRTQITTLQCFRQQCWVSDAPGTVNIRTSTSTETVLDTPSVKSEMLKAALHRIPEATKLNAPFDGNIETIPQNSLKFYIETYGCQMNLSDSEIVRSILLDAGHRTCPEHKDADVILTNTCAIRENAEAKVWHRLKYFQSIRNKNKVKGQKRYTPVVGVLGCMAERLKERLLEEEGVDFVCGPDAYRDIPSLLDGIVTAGQKQANTMLSFEETYADISPVREVNQASAFVSIMRGCNNMCSFCIVPFTRGRERSRPMSSILTEVAALSQNDGVKEVVLLGQNVNGYHDTSPESAALYPTSVYRAADGFENMYRSKKRDLPGARFADLLHRIADIDDNMRIRFTSPHPKDFPLDALRALADRPNICSAIHLPVQSGSTTNLQRMRRGYSRESYLSLVKQVRELIPNISISTDIIAGFCHETEEEHQDTLSLIREVQFDQAFMYAYSLRDRTHAAHNLEDNVPADVKKRRLQEIIDTYRQVLLEKNLREEADQFRLVLVEGPSSKSTPELPMLTGRTEGNKRVVFPAPTIYNNSNNNNVPLLVPAAQLCQHLHHHPATAVAAATTTTIAAEVATAAAVFGDLSSLSAEARLSLITHGLPSSIFNTTAAATGTGINLLNPGIDGSRSSSSSSSSKGIVINSTGMDAVDAVDAVNAAVGVGQYLVVRILKADTPTMRGVALGTSTIAEFPQLVAAWSTTA